MENSTFKCTVCNVHNVLSATVSESLCIKMFHHGHSMISSLILTTACLAIRAENKTKVARTYVTTNSVGADLQTPSKVAVALVDICMRKRTSQ